jgi:U5 small nuclear ribonucleoprotein component
VLLSIAIQVDRLITELKLPPGDAFYKLRHTIEEVNTIIASCSAGTDVRVQAL